MTKINKILAFALLLSLVFAGGCADSAHSKISSSGANAIDDIISSMYTSEQSSSQQSILSEPSAKIPSEEKEIDVDLTKMSATMVYSEVYNMMVTPDDYLGKTIKMSGKFKVHYDEGSDTYYFACIVQDATACCAQGIEFEGDYIYPRDYPDEGSEITVLGTFEIYQDGAYSYCRLKDAEMTF